MSAPRERPGLQALICLGAIVTVLVAIALVSMTSGGSRGLRADILSPRRAEPGERLSYTVSVRDTAGAVQA
ncbi:MAG: hypothetical protein ACRD0M_01505, partial [Acidimicrobiales bacterium]